jgi:hypothetical protein
MVVKYEINAFSMDEAKQKAAEMGLTIVKNVTPSWKNSNCPAFGTNDFKKFMVEMLDKKRLAAATGVGLIVATENGSADTRQRPWTFNNNVKEGSRATKRYFEVRTKDGNLVGDYEKKGDAVRAAKAAMSDLKQDMYCDIVYRVIDPDMAVAFTINYTPSVKAKMGTYVVFGNVVED